MLFGIIFLFLAFIFGAGTNTMTINSTFVVRNLWIRGLSIILGEYIRYKLIKHSSDKNLVTVVILLSITLAYTHMFDAHRLFIGSTIMLSIFYETVFMPLVISSVASYIAVKGDFWAVILLSFVYAMTQYLAPILPNISPIAWSLIVTAIIFVTAIIYRFMMDEKKRDLRKREQRAVKYAPQNIRSYVSTVLLLGIIIAFFMGAFPIYPVVILTGSMAGTFERGSLVFVQRVPHGEAFNRIGEGYVIHFLSRGRVSYIHRVIDFWHDEDGERQYITRGDASDLIDAHPVPQEDVLGIARASLPFFGYPYVIVQSIRQALSLR